MMRGRRDRWTRRTGRVFVVILALQGGDGRVVAVMVGWWGFEDQGGVIVWKGCHEG